MEKPALSSNLLRTLRWLLPVALVVDSLIGYSIYKIFS
jgi:hypothetical protein